MPRKTGIIEKLDAWHRGHSQFSRKPEARVSLWAITDLGDRVWLHTDNQLTDDSRSGEVKEQKMMERNQHLLGQKILYNYSDYKGIGFIREYLTSQEAKGL